MTFSFEYKKPSVIRALRYHFLSRKPIRLAIIVINVFTLLSAILYFTRQIPPLSFLMGSALWMATLGMFWWVLPSSIYRNNHTFRDHFTCDFTDHHFFIQNERVQKSWGWQQFSAWMETPDFIHLYFDSRSFFLVPKEAIPGAEELQRIRGILKEQIAGK